VKVDGQKRMLVATTIPPTFSAFLVPYARHLRAQGWQVDLATAPGELPVEAEAAVDNRIDVAWSRSLRDPKNATAALRTVRRALREGGYSIVHTHTPIASFVVRAAAASIPRRRRPAVVYTAHGFHFAPGCSRLANGVFTVAEWAAGRVTDRLVVINDHDEAAARKRHLVRADRLVHMHGIGVDMSWYRRTPALLEGAERLRRVLGIGEDTTVLTIVAELTVRKQQHVAIDALAKATSRNVHLVLAGDGPLRTTYEARAASAGVAERVHFLGNVRDVRPLMIASDATVLPSFREGMSRSVLESLALGVPVLGSRIRGIADVVEPDGGILFEPGDSDSLAKAIDDVATGPQVDEVTRARIRERLRPYGLEAVLAAHDDLYAAFAPDPGEAVVVQPPIEQQARANRRGDGPPSSP
jgi:glycosyltransferase involved in cell wall biosynthesis